MSNEITCIAQFIAKKEKTEQLKQSLMALIEPTRKESGCVSYGLHYNSENPNMFTMIEKFKDKEAFEYHGEQLYLENFKNIVGDLIESVDVSIYKKI
jgi:quinol monooxygenase YgiN